METLKKLIEKKAECMAQQKADEICKSAYEFFRRDSRYTISIAIGEKEFLAWNVLNDICNAIFHQAKKEEIERLQTELFNKTIGGGII